MTCKLEVRLRTSRASFSFLSRRCFSFPVSALLAVLTGRLGRTIDRARLLKAALLESDGIPHARIHQELNVLAQRAKLIYRAILLGSISALLVCFVIVSLLSLIVR